jgi:hypothetical protein
VAHEANVDGILYRSVRDRYPSLCLALLTRAGFAKPKQAKQVCLIRTLFGRQLDRFDFNF